MRSRWRGLGGREPSPVLRVGGWVSMVSCYIRPFGESLLWLEDCDVEIEGYSLKCLLEIGKRLLYFGLGCGKRAEGSRFVFG